MLVEIIEQNQNVSTGTNVLDRDTLFGDGFFTTAVIDNHQLSFQQQHFRRLTEAAKHFQYLDFKIESLTDALQPVLARTQSAVIRISIVRQQVARGYAISKQANTMCRMLLSPLPILPAQHCELFDAQTAISVNPSLAGFKHLNRLDSVLAASECSNKHQEALMFDGERVICGSRSNLFVRLKKQWCTPEITNCGITGITKVRVMEVIESRGLPCLEKTLVRSDLTEIDAAFVTNSLIGVWPAKSINGRLLQTSGYEEICQMVNR